MSRNINRHLLNVCQRIISPETSQSQAWQWDYRDELEDILNKGAKPNYKAKGTNPLCEASRVGNDIAVEILIERGASVNFWDKNKSTPLYLAASHGNYEVVKKLISNGAHLNMKNRMGYFPLMSAVENGHMNVAKLLVESGADVNIQRPNTFGVEMSLLTFVLFTKCDIQFSEMLLIAGVLPHRFGEAIVLILLDYGDAFRDLIKKLVLAGFDFYSDDWITKVRKKVNANLTRVSDGETEMVTFLEQEHFNPQCLQKMCRTVIRAQLSKSDVTMHICKKITLLPVPVILQNYLSLDYLPLFFS